MKNILKTAVISALLIVTTACSSAEVKPAEANPIPDGLGEGPGLFSGESGNILDAFRDKGSQGGTTSLGVNGFLWRASLETISFLPIIQADSAGGIIISDWYENPKNTAERIKVNVFIKGKKFRADALEVKVFKQTLKDGRWATVDAGERTASALEETILTKARSLRVAAESVK